MDKDASLEPVPILFAPTERHLKRQWQGIPGIERTSLGRLWVTFYSGGKNEGDENFCLLIVSDDDGRTWSKPVAIIDPPGKVRAFDPCLWLDPDGGLWWFWAQSYTKFDGRCGVWTSVCANPDAVHPSWSSPRRIEDGIMLNKPTVLRSGRWLFPCAVWCESAIQSSVNDPTDHAFSNVVASDDAGASFFLLGSADVPDRHFDEHMIVELGNGRLWMLVRTFYGVGMSFSEDGGVTWTRGTSSGIAGPDSRFFIRRLKSGRILLINHDTARSRSRLTAMLSDDEGKSWPHRLLLDEREGVSYPDATVDEAGIVRCVYDYSRSGEKEIRMARFTESDVIAGSVAGDLSVLRMLVSKA